MKKIIIIMLTVLISMELFGCGDNKNTEKNYVLNAWTGDFSQEKLKDTIYEYQQNYSNIVFEKADDISDVSFEVDFEVSSVFVTLLSRVDERDESVELNGYIDLVVNTKFDKNKVSVNTDWWFRDGESWVNKHPVWSYLVKVTDNKNTEHYYYFRVDYSAFQK